MCSGSPFSSGRITPLERCCSGADGRCSLPVWLSPEGGRRWGRRVPGRGAVLFCSTSASNSCARREKWRREKLLWADAAPAQVQGVLTASALPGVGTLDKGAEAFAAREGGPGSPPGCPCSATAAHRQQRGTAVTHVPRVSGSLVSGDGRFAPGNCLDGKSRLH